MRFRAAGLVVCALACLSGQPAAVCQDAAPAQLLAKAHTLESRGRLDMARQVWQQILLVDPKNPEALAGMARSAKLEGKSAEASEYLARLQAVDPTNPNIARIRATTAAPDTGPLLRQAGQLANQGQYARAAALLHQAYGDNPPTPEAALSYYTIEASVDDLRPHAIAGLRALADEYPDDVRFDIALGRILTWNPRTRAEGRKLLARHATDPEAADALRQALSWDEGHHPSITAQTSTFLARHPNTLPRPAGTVARTSPPAPAAARPKPSPAVETAAAPEAAQPPSPAATSPRRVPARASSVPAYTPQIQSAAARRTARASQLAAAYAALHAHRYAEAEASFQSLLAARPADAQALAGMGYVRLAQGNFSAAISFLSNAEAAGLHDAALARALRDARFYATLHAASDALQQGDVNLAVQQFRSAVQQRPTDAAALEGLAGSLLKAGQPERAIPVYGTDVRLHGSRVAAWKGLFVAYAAAERPEFALATDQRVPGALHAQLMADPEYLRALAAAYTATHQEAEAQRVLAAALELPFPAGARGLRADVLMQYAGLLEAAGRHEQAAGLLRQVLASNPENADAWIALVQADHASGNNAEAFAQLQSMPPAVFQRAAQQPGFVATAASVYLAQNREDLARTTLEALLAAQQAAHQRPSVAAQTTLAQLYLRRGDTVHAFPLFESILSANRERADAWKGLITSLHATGHDAEAIAEIGQMPAAVRLRLEKDPDYLQTVGAAYATLGQPQDAMRFFNRARLFYSGSHLPVPAALDIQTAWLLYNGGDDPSLYRQLMGLGGRPDLTDAQRRDVQTIWATWAVRRSGQSLAAGDSKRALAILNAAARAFPGNPAVERTVASGYTAAGQPKQAVELFRAQNLAHGTAADYRAAVTAALAAHDRKDAETWLRFGLNEYPKDAPLLTLAAKYETWRGHTRLAEEFYRASLKAMPAADPGAELAAEMARAAPPARLPAAQQPQDLATLLGQIEAQTAAAPAAAPRPYLPSLAGAPVQPPVQPALQVAPEQQGLQPAVPQPPLAVPAPGGVAAPIVLPPTSAADAAGAHGGTLGQYVPQAARRGPLTPYPFSRTIRFDASPQPGVRLVNAAWHGSAQTGSAQTGSAPGGVPAQQENPFAQFGLGPVPSAASSVPARRPSAAAGRNRKVRRSSTAAMRPAQGPRRRAAHIVSSRSPAAAVLPSTTFASPARPRFTPPAPVPLAQPLPSPRARAAAIRANQANSALVLEGTAHPPVEDYTTDAAPAAARINPAQYAAPSAAGRRSAAAQDGLAPQPPPSSTRSAQTSSTTFAQQYPQPTQRPAPALPHTAGKRAARSGTHAGTSRPAPARSAAAPSTIIYNTVVTSPPAPLEYPAAGSAAELPAPSVAVEPPPPGGVYPLPPAPTDEQLRLRNVPPLRGYFDTRAAAGPGLTARQQAELNLALLEAGYSPWAGLSGMATHRSGTAGLDRLDAVSAPVELTFTLGTAARLSIVPEGVFLRSGQLVLPRTPRNVPQLGTFYDSSPDPAVEQFASGVGGEVQLSTATFQAAAGYTPYGFPVANVVGGVRWRPGNWHVTFLGDRAPVRETMLSYAGLHDPGSDNGTVWGGVVSSGGGLRFDAGDEHAGLYAQAEAASLNGRHVLANRRIDGTLGAYFRIHEWPAYGALNIGGMLFGEHFRFNERGETFGLGGYFSPNAFLLAAVPVSFNGHWGQNLHYTLNGSLGVETFQEDSEIFFPLDPAQQALVPAAACTPVCGVQQASGTAPSYSFEGRLGYRVNEHWYIGAFLAANNTNNFNTASTGAFARFLFRPQTQTELYPTGLFPVEGLRPVRVP